MNKRKSVAEGEQAQSCKKLKMKLLDDAAGADTLDTGTASSTPSTPAASEASASASASAPAHAHANAITAKTHNTHAGPSSKRPNKRKAADDAESSQSSEPPKKRFEIDWKNFDLEAFEARGRGKSPPKYNFQWKEHVYKPRPPPTAFQRAFRNAPGEVHALFAAYPQTDSEEERERNGLPSPSSSVNGDAVQQPANVPSAQPLTSIPSPAPQSPAPQLEAAAGSNEDSREPVAGPASESGSTQRFSPASPEQAPASRLSSASPPPAWTEASSSRHRLNKGKSPVTRSGIEKDGSSHRREKRVPLLEKRRRKKNHGQRHPTDDESTPDAKHLEGFLRSTRSSRRGVKCELWCLSDDGTAMRSVNKW